MRRARGGTSARSRRTSTLERGVLLSAAPTWDDLITGEELASLTIEPARAARVERLPAGLDSLVVEALARRGVDGLFTHQAETWEAASRGEHVIVTTGTASGKSLAFNLPVLDAIAREPKTSALYLYPTKALAQDQARALAGLQLKGLRPAIYDGDTELERRWQVRKWANLILTNPDMLHVGMLPHHDRWGDVLHNLRYVVVDEATSTAACSDPTSATCCGGSAGSRAATAPSRSFCSPPPRSPTRTSSRRLSSASARRSWTPTRRRAPSARSSSGTPRSSTRSSECARARSAEASLLMAALVSRGLRTICFAKSRKAAELIHRFTAERVGSSLAARLAPYRAGYTPAQRREIERRLVEGELLGVSATDALELGIDIGSLDCAISVGFPARSRRSASNGGERAGEAAGSRSWWRARTRSTSSSCGSRKRCSARQVEATLLDHANPRILDPHVYAAAYEGPLTEADAETLGPEALERAPLLPELERTPAGFVWKGGTTRPAGCPFAPATRSRSRSSRT